MLAATKNPISAQCFLVVKIQFVLFMFSLYYTCMTPRFDKYTVLQLDEIAARDLLTNAMTLIELKNAKGPGREIHHIAIKAVDVWRLLYHPIAAKIHHQQNHAQTLASLRQAVLAAERVKARYAADPLIRGRSDTLLYYTRWLLETYGTSWATQMYSLLHKPNRE